MIIRVMMNSQMSFLVLVLCVISANNYVDTSLATPSDEDDTLDVQGKGKGDTLLGFLASFLSVQCESLTKLQETGIMREYNEDVIRIHHYAGRSFVTYRVLDAPHLLLQSSSFDPLRTTVIFIHGYRNTPDEPYIEVIADNFYKKGVNFLSYATNYYTSDSYLKAVASTTLLSRTLAKFIVNMIDLGYPRDHIYLAGFSLGAQFAGLASKIIRSERGILLPRITAIDPSTVCFSSRDSLKLDKNDAEYVDVIHTTILSFSKNPIGHADFYLNGEIDLQPGCETIVCGHSRGLVVYAESIINEYGFIAKECNSWLMHNMGQCPNTQMSLMGFHSPATSRGKYYLRTNSKFPFGMGPHGIL